MPTAPYIGYLGDHPETLEVLKAWFEEEWPAYYGPNGPGDALQDLQVFADRRSLPVALVAYQEQTLCGIAALKAEPFVTHPHLAPWASAGLVHPDYRRRGIGAALLRTLEEEARVRGYEKLYCATATATRLLERGGWAFMEQVMHEGERVSVYCKALQRSL